MDIPSAVIGIGMMLLFVVPIGYAVNSEKRKEKKIIKALCDFGHTKKLAIDTHEVIRKSGLGLDHGRRTLVFQNSKQELFAIKLADISQCEVLEKRKPGKTRNAKGSLYQVGLALYDTNANARELILYNEDTDGVTDAESLIPVAIKWRSDILNLC